MGRRAAGATQAAIVAAFSRRARWSQQDLAAEIDTTDRVVRRHLRELLEAGLDLEREEVEMRGWEPGDLRVYWTWRTRIWGEPRARARRRQP